MPKYILISLLVVFCAVGGATSARAEDVDVSNNVTVSANTGDNHGGTVREGEATVNIEVQQTINGVVLPPVIVSTSSKGGSVEASASVETIGTTTKVMTEIKTSGEVITNDSNPVNNAVNTKGSNPDQSAPVEPVAEAVENVEASQNSFVVGFLGSITGTIGTVLTALGTLYGAFINIFT
jgi:hypothetical protein